MTSDHDDTGYEPPHNSSPTDHVLAELQLYGYRPFQDEPNPRPLPDAQVIASSISDIFHALLVALADTRLEPDFEDLLRSTVNLSIAPSTGSNANSTITGRRSAVA
jgi:hypothetical protein